MCSISLGPDVFVMRKLVRSIKKIKVGTSNTSGTYKVVSSLSIPVTWVGCWKYKVASYLHAHLQSAPAHKYRAGTFNAYAFFSLRQINRELLVCLYHSFYIKFAFELALRKMF